jgi:hypothetical protein
MAIWNIEQKFTVWQSAEVEAETFEQAIETIEAAKAWDVDWTEVQDTFEPTPYYWGQNLETEETFITDEDGNTKQVD